MDNRPNVTFAVSDAVVKAAKQIGLKIPEEIGIVGFDNTDTSIMCDPLLTTVKQPQFQMGFMACEMLIEQIGDTSVVPRQLLLDVELIVRESL